MLRKCVIAAAALVAVVVGFSPEADARPGGKLKIGLPKGMFRDVPAAVIEAAASPFRDLFKRQAGLDGDVEILDDCHELAAQMKAGKVDIGVFTGYEFAWVRANGPEIVPLVVVVPHGKKLQGVLVVNAAAKAAKPADLGAASVVVPTGTKPHCHLFLERLLADIPTDACGIAKTDPKPAEEVLDGVAAGTLKAGLVDIATLTAYQNNKPGAGRALKVLAESDLFPPGVIAYRKGAIDTPTVSRIQTGLTKAGNTPQGRAFLMLARMKGFEELPPDFDAEMKRIYKAYPPAPQK